jgi:hypothetical protein
LTNEEGQSPEPAEIFLPPLTDDERAAIGAGPNNDSRSTAEAQQLSSGLSSEEIQRRAEENEAKRTEAFRNHFERLAVVTLYGAWAILMLLGLTWVYHLVASPCWPRLPDAQIDHIQSIITGGILVGLAGGHFKRRLGGGN